MTDMKGSTSSNPDINAQDKEWDNISCPICMDHPHNAVLLLCTSHEKGCRSYICDTSYRHSNCLDRFKKLRVEPIVEHHHPHHDHPDSTSFNPVDNNEGTLLDAINEHNNNLQHGHRESPAEPNSLKCPLCRGTVMGWMIVKEARQYWDMKTRSCSRESCLFSGNYGELRRHARRSHPLTRPADVDPTRQRAWHQLEHQREYGDILSAIRSAMPGSFVLGDYVIDDEGTLMHDRELGNVAGPWWATLFLFHMMGGRGRSHDEFRASSRLWRTRRRASGNRYLWGENLLGLQDDDNNDDDDDDDEILIPRRRRRFTRSRPDEERP